MFSMSKTEQGKGGAKLQHPLDRINGGNDRTCDQNLLRKVK